MGMHEEPVPPQTSYSDLRGPRRWLLDSMLDQLVEALRGSDGFQGVPLDVISEYAISLYDTGHLKLAKDKRGKVAWAMWKDGMYLPV